MSKILTKIVKYVDLSDASNAHIKNKINEAKTLDEAFKVFETNGWYLSPSIVSSLREDKASEEEDRKAKEEAEAKEAELKAQNEAEIEAAKEAAKIAAAGKPSASMSPEDAARYQK